MQNREEYKNLLRELYTLQPPFKKGRPRDRKNFEYELKQYMDMIANCLIIGDSDILYQFGIAPVEKDVTVLVGHSDLDMYISAFSKRFDGSNSDGEKFYLAMLIRALRAIKGEKISPEILRLD